jgi:hypothetical protein
MAWRRAPADHRLTKRSPSEGDVDDDRRRALAWLEQSSVIPATESRLAA